MWGNIPKPPPSTGLGMDEHGNIVEKQKSTEEALDGTQLAGKLLAVGFNLALNASTIELQLDNSCVVEVIVSDALAAVLAHKLYETVTIRVIDPVVV